MPLTADQFAKALVTSRLSTAEEVKAFWGQLPAGERPKDGDTFAAKLIAVEKPQPAISAFNFHYAKPQ
jgi:hypothetical protein